MLFVLIFLFRDRLSSPTEIESKLKVLNEFLRRTSADSEPPPVLGYVSHVDGFTYHVTYFNVNDLTTVRVTKEDDRVRVFNFLLQTYSPPEQLGGPKIKPHPVHDNKYYVLLDDGWAEMVCPPGELFDTNTFRCTLVNPCRGMVNGAYAMNKNALDRLVLDKRVVVDLLDPTDDIHPTLYVQCTNGAHQVRECPPGHVFDRTIAGCKFVSPCADRPDGYILSHRPDGTNANEYYACLDGVETLMRCADDQTFDTVLLQCTTVDPCVLHGAGFTFITDELDDNQFYVCETTTLKRLVTCMRRDFQDGVYRCGGDDECADFENGTGVRNLTVNAGKFDYYAGNVECLNYDKVGGVVCDTEEVTYDGTVFDGHFLTDLAHPKEVFDVDAQICRPFAMKLLTDVRNPYYRVSRPNDFDVSFETACRVDLNKFLTRAREHSLVDSVVYTKDGGGATGVNPETGERIDCFLNDHLYDVFSGKTLNVCADGELQTVHTFTPGQFFDAAQISIGDGRGVEDLGELVRAELARFPEAFTAEEVRISGVPQYRLESTKCGALVRALRAASVEFGAKYHPSHSNRHRSQNYQSAAQNYQTERQRLAINRYRAPQNIANPYSYQPDSRSVEENPPPESPASPASPADSPASPPTPPESPPPPDSPPTTSSDTDDSEEPPAEPVYDFMTVSAFYSLPTFRMDECMLDDEVVRDVYHSIWTDRRVEEGCSGGLAHMIGASVQITNTVKCVTELVEDGGSPALVVRAAHTEPVAPGFNFLTQSYDGYVYNKFLHRSEHSDDQWTACPDVYLVEGKCNVPDHLLLTLTPLQGG